MTLITVGLNHHTASFEAREKTALPENRVGEAVADLSARTPFDEAVIVATCNRFEVYARAHAQSDAKHLNEWITSYHRAGPDEFNGQLFELHGLNTVRHLLRVASGLDSMIVGEPQILGQVKSAYQIARDAKCAGGVLGRLFEHALATAKQVRSETELGRHRVSYASVAVDVCKKIFEDLKSKHALMIGSGEMIKLAARHFSGHHIGSITIANRSPENARRLAQCFGAKTLDFGAIGGALAGYDVIVSCTASSTPVLKKTDVAKAIGARKHRPLYIVDLALPRDVESGVSELDDVYLYTLDNLAHIVDANQELRRRTVQEAEHIIQKRTDEFSRWLNARRAADLVRRFRGEVETQRDEALAQALKRLRQEKDAEKTLTELARTLTNKLAHGATETINHAAESGDAELLDAALRLFDLRGQNRK